MPSPSALEPRTIRLLVLGVCVLLFFSIYRLGLTSPPGPYVAFSGATMGTTWEVKVASEDLGPKSMRRVGASIETALEDVVQKMSSWDERSEISRFNASNSTQPFPISESTLTVLQTAERISIASGGAFDVTVAPLVEVWGFGSTLDLDLPPTPETLAGLRQDIGFRLLSLDPAAPSLRKARPGVQVDLSAIAKGYGVDHVARALQKLGYPDFLIEVGGELRASGHKRDGSPWRVAIERPSVGIGGIEQVVVLDNQSMATSGDYRNHYEIKGERFSHTLDPRTGRPIRHSLASVTVIAPLAVEADAWATALYVLGPEAGFPLAEKWGLAAYFMIRTGPNAFEARETSHFPPLGPDPSVP